MSTRTMVTYRNVPFMVIMDMKRQKFKLESEEDAKWFCPLCTEKIEEGEEIEIYINNYKLFPNVTIHKECRSGVVDTLEDNILETIEDLHDSYKEYKDLKYIIKSKYLNWEV